MTTFGVWAPYAKRRVDVVLGERLVPMTVGPGRPHWYTATVEDVATGSEYAFSVDEGEALPDPRSQWQAAGVHGWSRVYDHRAYPWTDHDWRGLGPLADQVIYELHVGTFSEAGTFAGAIAHLEHLVELGVTAVSMLPVAQFSGPRGWGYDGVDLYAPHHDYGGPDGLKAFVDACHGCGLGVILDVVYNHLGPEGNYVGRFGPYFTDFYTTPWGAAINYDQAGSDEVRRFVIDNALMWLRDYHVDGLRLDSVHAIVDTRAVHVLEQLAAEVDALEAQLAMPKVLIAESDLNDPRVVRATEVGGYGIDAQWSDDFHHALHAVLTGEHRGYYRDFGRLAELATALERVFVYAGRYSASRQRTHGRAPTGLAGDRFVAYLQNHDQVGNRAGGDRISHLVGRGRLQVGAALVLTSPFVPLLLQGEEWAATTPFQYFTSHEDTELGRAVSQGRRSEFAAFDWAHDSVPDPQDPATFTRSKLDWSEAGCQPHTEILAWYRDLIALRRSTPALRAGELPRVRCDEVAGWLVVERGPVTIAVNLSDAPQPVPVGEERPATLLLASAADLAVSEGVSVLPPDSVAILGP